jgi:hypothetical protein
VVGSYLVRGVWFPNRFATGGNWSYPDYWSVTGDPRYPGYKTPTVTPEPSVERVAGPSRLTDGRIGTHMILWGTLQDSEVIKGLKASMIRFWNPVVVPTM